MRFLYGLLLGVMTTTVGAILYLAFLGGDYLLQLSPTYQEMRTRLGELERTEEHRRELVGRLESMNRKFAELAERFDTLRQNAPMATPEPEPPPAENAETGEGDETASGPADEPSSTP